MAHAGVHAALTVENDVLRPVNQAERQNLDVAEAVVDRIGRAAARRHVGGVLQLVEGGTEIGLLQDLVPVLLPFDVEGDRDQQHDPEHRRGRPAGEALPDHYVCQNLNDHRPGKGACDRPSATAECDTAENDGGDHGDLQPDSGIEADTSLAGAVEHAAKRGEHRACDISREHRRPDADAGLMRRFAGSSHGLDVPPHSGARVEQVEDERDDGHGHDVDGHAEQRAASEEIPFIIVGIGRGDRVTQADQQQLHDRSVDHQRGQGHQKGSDLHDADEEAVHGSEHGSDHKHDRHGRIGAHLLHVDEVDGGQIGEREDRAHRQVDPSAEYDNRHAERDDGEFGELPPHRHQVRRAEIAGNEGVRRKQHDHHHGHGHDRVDPRFREHFPEHVGGQEPLQSHRRVARREHSARLSFADVKARRREVPSLYGLSA